MRARRLPLGDLGSCSGAEWVDATRRPFVSEGWAWLPVRDGFAWDAELPERDRRARRRYQRLGDCVVFHGPRPDGAAVRDVVARYSPRGVLWARDHLGSERVPQVELLVGEAGVVTHRENGLVYRLDPARVMFSQGNREEKARLAGMVRPGERTADLFAGIGYFSLPAARAGADVHAMEINPVAFAYLAENVGENGLSDRVEADCGDCRDLLRGVYDRLVLGHFESPSYLADALAHARSGSVLHIHAVERKPGETEGHLGRTAAGCGYESAVSRRRVKKCGPCRVHTVYDMVIL